VAFRATIRRRWHLLNVYSVTRETQPLHEVVWLKLAVLMQRKPNK